MYDSKISGYRQLRSAHHYANKITRQERRADRQAAKADHAHSFRSQQHHEYKAAKHLAKADYAGDMYDSKISGYRQLRSAHHYANKITRQERRADRQAAKADHAHSFRS